MAAIPVEILIVLEVFMRIRSGIAVALVAAGVLLPAGVYAAPINVTPALHAMFAKSQNVKVSLRNDSGSKLELKVGEQLVSLEAGKAVSLKLPVGTKIVVNATSGKHQAGEVLTEATSAVDNSTVVIQ